MKFRTHNPCTIKLHADDAIMILRWLSNILGSKTCFGEWSDLLCNLSIIHWCNVLWCN